MKENRDVGVWWIRLTQMEPEPAGLSRAAQTCFRAQARRCSASASARAAPRSGRRVDTPPVGRQDALLNQGGGGSTHDHRLPVSLPTDAGWTGLPSRPAEEEENRPFIPDLFYKRWNNCLEITYNNYFNLKSVN